METKSDRRLGAVVFTDIVDFTKLMSKDESKALETLQKKNNIEQDGIVGQQTLMLINQLTNTEIPTLTKESYR